MNIEDWDRVREEGRAKLIYIGYEEVLSYCAIRHGREDIVNLMSTYEMPNEWSLGGVHLVFDRRSFAFVIFSPDFDPYPVGMQLPTMDACQHLIKITRERITEEG